MFSPSRGLEAAAALWAIREDHIDIKSACEDLDLGEDHSEHRFDLQPNYLFDALGDGSATLQ